MSPAHISTIEEEYEYRINRVVKKLLRDYEFVPNDGDELFAFLWEHTKELGKYLHEDMSIWKSEDEWLEELDE